MLDMSSKQFTGRGETTPDRENEARPRCLIEVRLTQLAIQMALLDIEADTSEKPSKEEIEHIQNIEQMASSIVRHSRSFLNKVK